MDGIERGQPALHHRGQLRQAPHGSGRCSQPDHIVQRDDLEPCVAAVPRDLGCVERKLYPGRDFPLGRRNPGVDRSEEGVQELQG
ncbi:MAG: hypothetical protein ACRDQI_07030 [Pseudonocardiaceae bacterium]